VELSGSALTSPRVEDLAAQDQMSKRMREKNLRMNWMKKWRRESLEDQADPVDVQEEDQAEDPAEDPADDDLDAGQLRKPWNRSMMPSLRLLALTRQLKSTQLFMIAMLKIKAIAVE